MQTIRTHIPTVSSTNNITNLQSNDMDNNVSNANPYIRTMNFKYLFIVDPLLFDFNDRFCIFFLEF